MSSNLGIRIDGGGTRYFVTHEEAEAFLASYRTAPTVQVSVTKTWAPLGPEYAWRYDLHCPICGTWPDGEQLCYDCFEWAFKEICSRARVEPSTLTPLAAAVFARLEGLC